MQFFGKKFSFATKKVCLGHEKPINLLLQIARFPLFPSSMHDKQQIWHPEVVFVDCHIVFLSYTLNYRPFPSLVTKKQGIIVLSCSFFLLILHPKCSIEYAKKRHNNNSYRHYFIERVLAWWESRTKQSVVRLSLHGAGGFVNLWSWSAAGIGH